MKALPFLCRWQRSPLEALAANLLHPVCHLSARPYLALPRPDQLMRRPSAPACHSEAPVVTAPRQPNSPLSGYTCVAINNNLVGLHALMKKTTISALH